MTFTQILAQARRLATGDSTDTTYSTADITVSANNALDRVVTLIRDAEGRWQWDDSNNTDFPIATTALVADQQDYGLDATHYRIQRIEIMDEDGNWNLISSIDEADVYNQSITDFLKTAGNPKYYDKVGNSIFLYPKPSYSQSASLKVFYERGPSYFTTSDTTKTPGFNPMFHELVALWSAYDYAFINQLKIKADLEKEIAKKEDKLIDYYSLRSRDEHIRFSARPRNYR